VCDSVDADGYGRCHAIKVGAAYMHTHILEQASHTHIHEQVSETVMHFHVKHSRFMISTPNTMVSQRVFKAGCARAVTSTYAHTSEPCDPNELRYAPSLLNI
jgi:hypothetical protein